MPVIVKPEQIEKGIQKYNAERDDHLEHILKNGGIDATVFLFLDGRVLVKFSLMESAILYSGRQELFNLITL